MTGALNHRRHIEPFACRRPTDVELPFRRLHEVEPIIVNFVVEFCIRNINTSFMRNSLR